MISKLGPDELAAILPAGMVSFLPGSFAIGLMTSLNTFVSQSMGRGETKECSNYCWQAIYMGLAYFAIVTAIMWPGAPAIFKMMGYGPRIVEMEVAYLRIMLYAQMIAIFIWSSSQFFMGIHRPIITMYSSICAQIVNVIANYVLIFGKFGFPAMGIEGAAWGTFIGTFVGAAIRMVMFLGKSIDRDFHSKRTLNINLSRMFDLLKVGLPAGLGLMINVAFWSMILFSLVVPFGKEASAATSAVFACINVSVMPVVGIGTALTAAVGKAIGENRKDIAIAQTSACLRIALIYMGFIGLCLFVFRNSLMEVWSSDAKVVAAGVNLLICAAIFQMFDASVLIYSGALRGAGDTVWLAVVSALGAVFILGLGGILILKFFPELKELGPWIAATVNIIAVGLANRWRFKSNSWMKIDLFKQRAGAVPIEIEAVVE